MPFGPRTMSIIRCRGVGSWNKTYRVRLMNRICPHPARWNDVFNQLMEYAKTHRCIPPPKPLILAGWAFSNDLEKLRRWSKTVNWANENGCAEIVSSLSDEDFYCVQDATIHEVGSGNGPK